MNKEEDYEDLFIKESLLVEEDIVPFDPSTREIGKIKEKWRQNDEKKRQKRKKRLCYIALILFILAVFQGTNRYIERYPIKKCTKQLCPYEMFIPDYEYFDEIRWNEARARGIEDDDTTEHTKILYEIYKETLLSCKEKWNFEMICFSEVGVGKKRGHYYISTYDTELTDKLLEFSFFELKEGYPFTDNRNEVWALGKDKKDAPAVLEYESGDGNTYRFDVVGTMKYDFLPVGYGAGEDAEAQVTELWDESTTYLLNPYCDFLKGKELTGEICNVFIRFDEENKEEAMKEMEQYGHFTVLK